MPDQLNDIVSRMVEAGESEQDIALVIQRMSHEQPPRHPHAKVADWVMENAPMVGGMAAGLASGGAGLIPAAIAAGGGGFLGARLRGDDRPTAAVEGVKQGATDLAGGVITKGLIGGARRLYGGLLKPNKALKDGFGDAKTIADTLLAERVPISRGGVEKVTGRLSQSRGAAMDMVKEAERAGTQGVVAKDVLSEFGPVVSELRKRVDIGQADDLAKVGQRGKAILRTTGGRGGDLALTRAQALKETAQDASSGAYRVMERGGQKQLSADDLLDTATARGFKQGIERKVPGVKAQNARTQKLIGGTRALEDAVEREANNNVVGGGRDWAAMGAGALGLGTGGPAGGAAAAMAMRLLATPSTGSRIAIGANEMAKLPVAQLIRMAQMQQLRNE